MGIDVKYGRVTTERGHIPDDEPVVVFRAQDRLLPSVLREYRFCCVMADVSAQHLAEVDAALAAVDHWQSLHPTKTPDPLHD